MKEKSRKQFNKPSIKEALEAKKELAEKVHMLALREEGRLLLARINFEQEILMIARKNFKREKIFVVLCGIAAGLWIALWIQILVYNAL